MLGVVTLTQQTLQSRSYAVERRDLALDAQFAMQRMVQAVSRTRLLLIPVPDRTKTGWRENVREETVPASPPEPGSSKATAVLAVTLDGSTDRDGNGKPDADNDGDGRLDEDWSADSSNDGKSGVAGIDDGGGGVADSFSDTADDDEDGFIFIGPTNEDTVNGQDDDSDDSVDEDATADMNGDGAPGIKGVDDDGDGLIDEGSVNDDDEDGKTDEDWPDPVVFYLSGNTLYERTPVRWDVDGNATINGLDFVANPIAANVTHLRVERVANSGVATPLVDLTLELTGPTGEVISLNTRVGVGTTQ